jgi:hypothetical protein
MMVTKARMDQPARRAPRHNDVSISPTDAVMQFLPAL